MGRRRLSNISLKWQAIQNKVLKTDSDCWLWQGHTNAAGYGIVTCENMTDLPENSGQVTVHKVSYLYHYGRLPKDKIILHDCDNKRCCNPEHLRAGTHLENSRDAQERGRLRGINYIKEYGCTRTELARKLNITQGNLSNRMRKWGNPYYKPPNR